MAGAGLDADLADACQIAAKRAKLTLIAFHERFKLFDGAVRLADLADLATDGDGQSGRLGLPDRLRQLGGVAGVQLLLLQTRLAGEIDERRGIDIDVAVPGGDRLLRQVANGLNLTC